MILTIKTDSSIAQIGLWDGNSSIEIYEWEAKRQLSAQLLDELEKLLDRHDYAFRDVTGLAVFKGPGSFTGLRIGATVANTIAYAQDIPIIGAKGDNWQTGGLVLLKSGKNDKQVIPEYGAPANVTKPKKTFRIKLIPKRGIGGEET